MEANLRKGLRRTALLTASTATKQLLHTNPRIGIAELCDKSGFDLRSALLCLRHSRRQGDSILRNGPTMPAHPVAHDKTDPCEKWRLENTAEGQILFVRKPEPDAAPADLEVNFKPVAIPVVDQSVAPLGHLVNFAGAHECQTF